LKSFPHEATYHHWVAAAEKRSGVTGQAAKLHVWLQVAVTYALLEATLWTSPGPIQFLWMTLTAASVVLFTLGGRYSARELGIGVPPAAGSGRILGYGIILALVIPLVSALLGYNSAPTHWLSFRATWQYAIWAMVQQFMLQSFFYLRLESGLGSRWAVLAAAVLFASTHIPNPVLIPFSLLGGLFFCEMFRHYRSILPLGVVHAVLGFTIAASFSDAVLHRMRVGIGYLQLH